MIKPLPRYIFTALGFSALLLLPPAGLAAAEDIDTNPEADALQQRVESTAATYDSAVAAAQSAAQDLDANSERIAELEALIPVQQERSDAAARELYKFQKQSPGIVNLLLDSENFFDFLDNLDYVSRITQANVEEIARLNEMKAELAAEQTALEQAKADADASAAEAERALVAAQEARLEAQRQAQEAARQAAEANPQLPAASQKRRRPLKLPPPAPATKPRRRSTTAPIGRATKPLS